MKQYVIFKITKENWWSAG